MKDMLGGGCEGLPFALLRGVGRKRHVDGLPHHEALCKGDAAKAAMSWWIMMRVAQSGNRAGKTARRRTK